MQPNLPPDLNRDQVLDRIAELHDTTNTLTQLVEVINLFEAGIAELSQQALNGSTHAIVTDTVAPTILVPLNDLLTHAWAEHRDADEELQRLTELIRPTEAELVLASTRTGMRVSVAQFLQGGR